MTNITINICPACGCETQDHWCCGIHLTAPFRMTKNRVIALRSYAHGRKGVDQATYKLMLQAVGVTSTLQLTRDSHNALLRSLGKLPDRPRQAKQAASA